MLDTIKQVLGITSNDPGVLSLSKGTFTLRREYYWRPKSTPADFFATTVVKLQVAGFTVTNIEYGDVYKAFKGGEGVKKNSHYLLRFKVALIPVNA